VLRAFLVGLVIWSLWTALRVRNPDAPIPRLAELAAALDAAGVEAASGDLAFYTRAGPERRARYRFDAVRYALAPRPLVREQTPRAPWLLTDAGELPAGYEPVATQDGIALLRRR